VNLAYFPRRNPLAACVFRCFAAGSQARRGSRPPIRPHPYLAFSRMLEWLGSTVSRNKIDPGQPLDQGHLRSRSRGTGESSFHAWVAGENALDALERDYQFLLKGDVFTEEMLNT